MNPQVIDRRIAAVLDKGTDVIGLRIAAHHHDRSAAHGDAVYHHEVIPEDLVGDPGPRFDVVAVVPAHLDGVAF